jgi:hypothetical protein
MALIDLLRLRLLRQGDAERQHAALQLGIHLSIRHDARKRDTAADRAVAALAAVEPLPPFLVLVAVLALDGEHTLVHVDVDLIAVESGQRSADQQVRLGLGDIGG